MKVRIQKSADSLVIVIPQQIVDELKLKEDSLVDIHFGEAPKVRPVYRLEDLLAQITNENKHGEIKL